MPQQSQHPQTSQATGRFMGQLLIWMSRSTALTVEVFFHRSFGSRYVGSGLWGLFIIFIFSWFFPDENLRPLMWFGATYGVLWLIAVAAVWIRRWRAKTRCIRFTPGGHSSAPAPRLEGNERETF